MDKSQAAPPSSGQLSKEDLQILKRIEQPAAVPLTEAEREDLIVNQILLRRLMRALSVEPATQSQAQPAAPLHTKSPRPAEQAPRQPEQANPQSPAQPLEKAA